MLRPAALGQRSCSRPSDSHLITGLARRSEQDSARRVERAHYTGAQMAKRPTLEERIETISHLREQCDTGEASRTLLGKEISCKSSLAVAAAARAIGELGLEELGHELPKAFARLLREPAKSDPQCAAKLAIVEALSALDAPTDDLFPRSH